MIPLVSFFSLTTIIPFVEDSNKAEAAQFSMAVDFLIQTGINFYDQGRLSDAMHEFKKALIVDPHSLVAKEFLGQIQKKLLESVKVQAEEIKGLPKSVALEKALDAAEKKIQLLKDIPLYEKEKLLFGEKLEEREVKESILKQALVSEPKVIEPEKTIVVNAEIKATQPNTLLELEVDTAILIQGDNIKRFLNTTPDIIDLSRHDKNTILIMGKEVGNAIFHIWDNAGRWTFNLKVSRKRYLEKLKEEFQKRELEEIYSAPFKISYSFDESTFHQGRRIDTTERKSLSLNQSVGVRGETPYGNYDASSSISRLNKQYEVDNLTMGLTETHFWGLEHLNLRIFDFGTGFAAYKFPGTSLRGIHVDAPMFGRKLHYNTFWGGLPEGNYTHLSPGLGQTKEAYLEGVGLSYKFSRNTQYKFYYAHSYGSELSTPVLTDKAFGVGAFYSIGKLNFNSEVAYDDNDHISYTSSASLNIPKTNISLSFTEDDRDFTSLLGGEPSGGSTSANLNLGYSLTEDIQISNSFSATRSRDTDLVNPNDPKRPNYSLSSAVTWRLDPFTTIDFSYNRNDTKGSVSPALTQSKTINLSKQIYFIKKINTYLSYTNSIDKNFTGSASNYDRNSLSGGLNFELLNNIFFSIGKSINFVEERFTKETSSPHTTTTSLSYNSRIFNSPFYGNLRVSFRDEEETESAISFLSGEDKLEFEAGLDYRPKPGIEGYLDLRASNIWAEKEGSDKRFDAEIRYGLRLAWDTGFRWNIKGNLRGFVFYDLDGDGIKDKDEGGVKDVTINTSSDKTTKTNEEGYYFIKNIVGKKADISIDVNTIPRGYILTTPSFYEVNISHGGTKRLDFGITTRSEIVGNIFVDLDGNNKFDREDESVSGVVIILDDKEKTVTDSGGQYLFRKLTPGEHTIKLDLKTIPTQYIPKTPLKKTISLEEGETFFYNIPLRVALPQE